MGGFLEGHGDVFRNNRCLIGLNKDSQVDDGCRDPHCGSKIVVDNSRSNYEEGTIIGGLWGGCENSHVTLSSNEYFTPDGTAMLGCGDDAFTLEAAATQFGLEINSTSRLLPDEGTILGWAESMVMRPCMEWSLHRPDFSS